MEALPGPVGLVGSAWRADLQVLLEEPDRIPGGLVVVPHDLSPENLDGIRSALELALPGRYLLVDEMGLLVELYPSADWACVGGGFHRGIHSTVEPAVAGLPVICGPKHAGRFPETSELVKAGILTVCADSKEIHAWLAGEPWKKERRLPFLEQKRQSYVHLLESCRSIR
jgi:3-deoxy-D-manno-octulosonic-acid transferase